MPDYEPEKMELASRDVVSRRMEEHIATGHGAKGPFGEHLWLDIRLLGAEHINSRLREVKEICQYFLGIDPAQSLIPVRPAQHYSMGGIRTDHLGHAHGLQGLFAAGEAACWDLHGFNRLGGNSVAETVVAGMIVGESIADYCDSDAGRLAMSATLPREALHAQELDLQQLQEGTAQGSAVQLIREMQDTMTDKVGIFRDGERLSDAVRSLRALHARSLQLRLGSSRRGANPELVAAYRLRRMLKLAMCVTEGALARTESRGAHFRADFPQRNDRDWLKRTLCRWNPGAEAPTLEYEPIDVMQMELVPGWRGYGARDFIAHPDTPQREAELSQLAALGLDPEPLQQAVLPFRDALPPGLRALNERLQNTQGESQ
jgi:fumarate reductase flavoprotein subunit